MFTDSHCHLDRLELSQHQNSLAVALDAARRAGVNRFLAVAVDLDDHAGLVDIANQFADVGISVGVHPCEDTDMLARATVDTLCNMAVSHPRVWAIGETGFDYHYSSELALQQRQSFINHIHASQKLGKPLIVHTREARQDTIDVLRAEKAQHGILHCFTEDWDTAKAAIDLGFYISFSGIISFKSAQTLRDVAKQVPLDRLLIETDCPFLAPMPYRGKPNEPAYLPHVALALADTLQISVAKLAEITSNNFDNLLQQGNPNA